MYKYLIVFVLAMPLVGVWFVEHGDVTSMGIYGEPNGATEAFAAFAGLTVDQFQRRTSVVEYTRGALKKSLTTVATFAGAEGLGAHGRSAAIRFAK